MNTKPHLAYFSRWGFGFNGARRPVHTFVRTFTVVMTLLAGANTYAQFGQNKALEQYMKDHFDDLYTKYHALNQQSSFIIDLQRQIEELRNENQTMRAQIEELQHQSSSPKGLESMANLKRSDRVKPLISDKVEGKTPSDESEKNALNLAKAAIRNNNMQEAIDYLEPLTTSKNAEIASETQYWLGLSYVTQKQCNSAMPYLQSFYQASKNKTLVPDALLAYSICQKQSGDNTGYQKTISTLKSLYPQSPAAKSLP